MRRCLALAWMTALGACELQSTDTERPRAYFVQMVEACPECDTFSLTPVAESQVHFSLEFWLYMAQNFGETTIEILGGAIDKRMDSSFAFYNTPDSLLLFQTDSSRFWCRLPEDIERGEIRRNSPWFGFFVVPDSPATDTVYRYPIQPLTPRIRRDYRAFREQMLSPRESGTVFLFSDDFRADMYARLRPYELPEHSEDGSWSLSPCN